MKLNFLNKAQAQLECEKSSGFSQMNMGMMMGIDPEKKSIHDSDYITFLKSHCLEWPELHVKAMSKAFLELQRLLLKRKVVIGKVLALNLIHTTGGEYLHQCHFVGGSVALPEDFGNSSLKSLTQDYNIPVIGKFLTNNQYPKVFLTALFHLWVEANLEKFKAMCLALGYETVSLSLPTELASRIRDNRLEHIDVKKEVMLKNKKMVSVVPIRFYNEHCLFDGKRHDVKENIERSGTEYTSQAFMVVSQNAQGVYEPVRKTTGECWFLTESECLDNSLFAKTSTGGIHDHPAGILCEQFIEYVLNPSKLSVFNLALFDNFFKSEQPKPNVASNSQDIVLAAEEVKPLLNQYQPRSYSSGHTHTQTTSQSETNPYKKRY